MSEEKIILYSSDEAATFKTGLSGWVSSNGHYYGKSEEAARYDGCTHRKCQSCDHVTEKTWTHCKECRRKRSAERYNALPFKEWDGKIPLVIWQDDQYFFDEDDIYQYCEDHECLSSDLMLVICDPIYLYKINEEYWNDCLPEDHDVPDGLRTKIREFNEFIATLPPTAWQQGKARTTVELDIEKSI